MSWRPRTAGGVTMSESKGREPGGRWCESRPTGEGEKSHPISASQAGKRDELLNTGLTGFNVGGPTLGKQSDLLNPPIKC